ncbi:MULTISPECIES: sulfite exporter TauE/SafE family protein [unclassified Shinella]|uniref:sulfite exporter TauE/SafE family protein n=1 Tax=unclassified Shinella TaxID=2643062 RepID=UPI00225D94B2|nr:MULTISPECIES: sulfite exporter TauE/SafE family protein [unclassified Shinella]MCO5138441.1 sulfite exporter TauE/SafE family protein [Shinella sp.]MDC7255277.1 sulfite exporter TauE/SafE family protein [Shinella sp. YE25]CAI0338048.1 putative membrane transporter protein [Rhizobiaceae bacterium]CAK7256509.1 putative membrane transporter protein [Shinella sp. WSC3-e]
MPSVADLALFALALVAAGVVSGLLAGIFGIGGGAILVPVFYQVFGYLDVPEAVRMHLSIGTSIAIIVPTSIRSFTAHRLRGAVDTDLLKSWLVALPFGAILASVIAAVISSVGLRLVFVAIALLVALRMLFNRDTWRVGNELPTGIGNQVAGVVIGTLSGLMGIGGGVLNNTYMTSFGRPIHQAVATSSGVGVLISIPGIVGYIWAGWGEPGLPPFSTGFINWVAVALIVPIALIVTPWGVRLAHSMSKRQLEIGFGIFLILVSLRFLASIYG